MLTRELSEIIADETWGITPSFENANIERYAYRYFLEEHSADGKFYSLYQYSLERVRPQDIEHFRKTFHYAKKGEIEALANLAIYLLNKNAHLTSANEKAKLEIEVAAKCMAIVLRQRHNTRYNRALTEYLQYYLQNNYFEADLLSKKVYQANDKNNLTNAIVSLSSDSAIQLEGIHYKTATLSILDVALLNGNLAEIKNILANHAATLPDIKIEDLANCIYETDKAADDEVELFRQKEFFRKIYEDPNIYLFLLNAAANNNAQAQYKLACYYEYISKFDTSSSKLFKKIAYNLTLAAARNKYKPAIHSMLLIFSDQSRAFLVSEDVKKEFASYAEDNDKETAIIAKAVYKKYNFARSPRDEAQEKLSYLESLIFCKRSSFTNSKWESDFKGWYYRNKDKADAGDLSATIQLVENELLLKFRYYYNQLQAIDNKKIDPSDDFKKSNISILGLSVQSLFDLRYIFLKLNRNLEIHRKQALKNESTSNAIYHYECVILIAKCYFQIQELLQKNATTLKENISLSDFTQKSNHFMKLKKQVELVERLVKAGDNGNTDSLLTLIELQNVLYALNNTQQIIDDIQAAKIADKNDKNMAAFRALYNNSSTYTHITQQSSSNLDFYRDELTFQEYMQYGGILTKDLMTPIDALSKKLNITSEVLINILATKNEAKLFQQYTSTKKQISKELENLKKEWKKLCKAVAKQFPEITKLAEQPPSGSKQLPATDPVSMESRIWEGAVKNHKEASKAFQQAIQQHIKLFPIMIEIIKKEAVQMGYVENATDEEYSKKSMVELTTSTVQLTSLTADIQRRLDATVQTQRASVDMQLNLLGLMITQEYQQLEKNSKQNPTHDPRKELLTTSIEELKTTLGLQIEKRDSRYQISTTNIKFELNALQNAINQFSAKLNGSFAAKNEEISIQKELFDQLNQQIKTLQNISNKLKKLQSLAQFIVPDTSKVRFLWALEKRQEDIDLILPDAINRRDKSIQKGLSEFLEKSTSAIQSYENIFNTPKSDMYQMISDTKSVLQSEINKICVSMQTLKDKIDFLDASAISNNNLQKLPLSYSSNDPIELFGELETAQELHLKLVKLLESCVQQKFTSEHDKLKKQQDKLKAIPVPEWRPSKEEYEDIEYVLSVDLSSSSFWGDKTLFQDLLCSQKTSLKDFKTYLEKVNRVFDKANKNYVAMLITQKIKASAEAIKNLVNNKLDGLNRKVVQYYHKIQQGLDIPQDLQTKIDNLDKLLKELQPYVGEMCDGMSLDVAKSIDPYIKLTEILEKIQSARVLITEVNVELKMLLELKLLPGLVEELKKQLEENKKTSESRTEVRRHLIKENELTVDSSTSEDDESDSDDESYSDEYEATESLLETAREIIATRTNNLNEIESTREDIEGKIKDLTWQTGEYSEEIRQLTEDYAKKLEAEIDFTDKNITKLSRFGSSACELPAKFTAELDVIKQAPQNTVFEITEKKKTVIHLRKRIRKEIKKLEDERAHQDQKRDDLYQAHLETCRELATKLDPYELRFPQLVKTIRGKAGTIFKYLFTHSSSVKNTMDIDVDELQQLDANVKNLIANLDSEITAKVSQESQKITDEILLLESQIDRFESYFEKKQVSSNELIQPYYKQLQLKLSELTDKYGLEITVDASGNRKITSHEKFEYEIFHADVSKFVSHVDLVISQVTTSHLMLVAQKQKLQDERGKLIAKKDTYAALKTAYDYLAAQDRYAKLTKEFLLEVGAYQMRIEGLISESRKSFSDMKAVDQFCETSTRAQENITEQSRKFDKDVSAIRKKLKQDIDKEFEAVRILERKIKLVNENPGLEELPETYEQNDGIEKLVDLLRQLHQIRDDFSNTLESSVAKFFADKAQKAKTLRQKATALDGKTVQYLQYDYDKIEKANNYCKDAIQETYHFSDPKDIVSLLKNLKTSEKEFAKYAAQADRNYKEAFKLYKAEFRNNKNRISNHVTKIAPHLISFVSNYQKVAGRVNQSTISQDLSSKMTEYNNKIAHLSRYYDKNFYFLDESKIEELALDSKKLRDLISDVVFLHGNLSSLTLDLKKAILAEKFAERCNAAREDLQRRLPGDTKYTALVDSVQQKFVIDVDRLYYENWEDLSIHAFENELQNKVYSVLGKDVQEMHKEEQKRLTTQQAYLVERIEKYQLLVSTYQAEYKKISELGVYSEESLKGFSVKISEFSNLTTVLSDSEFESQKTAIHQEIMFLESKITNIQFAIGMYVYGVAQIEAENFNTHISNYTDLLQTVSADKLPQLQELHRTFGLSITYPITEQHIIRYFAKNEGDLKDHIKALRDLFETAKEEVKKLDEKVEDKKQKLNSALDQTQVRIQENITKKEGVASGTYDAEIEEIRIQLIKNCDLTSEVSIADIENQFSEQVQEQILKPIDDKISSVRSEVEQQIQALQTNLQTKQEGNQEEIENLQTSLAHATNLHQLTNVKSEAERVTIVVHAEAIQDQYQEIQQKSEVLFSNEFTRHCTGEERSLVEEEIEAIKREFATVEKKENIETRAGNTKDLIHRYERLQQSMSDSLHAAQDRRTNLHSNLQGRKTNLSKKIQELSGKIVAANQLGVSTGTAPALLETYQELDKVEIPDDEKAMSGLLESIEQQETKFAGELSSVQTNIVQELRLKFEKDIDTINQGLTGKVVDAKTNDKVKKVFEVLQIPASDTISVEKVIDVLLETSSKEIKQVVEQLDAAVKTANGEITRVNQENLDNARKEEERKVKEALTAKISDAKSKVQQKINSMRANPKAQEEVYQTKITQLQEALYKADSLRDITSIYTAVVREEYIETRKMSEALFNGEFSKHCSSECKEMEKEFEAISKESQAITQAKTIEERIARTQQLIIKHEELQQSMRDKLKTSETRRSNLHGNLQGHKTNLSQKIEDLSNEIEKAKQLGVNAGTAPALLKTYQDLEKELDKAEIKDDEQAMTGLLTSVDVEEAKFAGELSNIQTNVVQTLRQKFEKDIDTVSQGLAGKMVDAESNEKVKKIFDVLQIPVSETISVETIIKVLEETSPTQIKQLVGQVEEAVKAASADVTRVVDEKAAQKRDDEAVEIFATAEEITKQHADIQTRLKALGISATTVSDPKDASQPITIAPAPKQERGSEVEYDQWKKNIGQAQKQYSGAIQQDKTTLHEQLSITLSDKLDCLNETIRNHKAVLTKSEKVPQLRKVFEMLKQDTTSLQSELDKETVIDAVLNIESIAEFQSLVSTIDSDVQAAVVEVSQRHQAVEEAKEALAEQLVQPREKYQGIFRDLLEYEEEDETKTDVSRKYLAAISILEKSIRDNEACETQEGREKLIKSFEATLDEYVQEAKEEISKTISAEQQTLTEIEGLLTNLKDDKELKMFGEFKQKFMQDERSMASVKKDIVIIHAAHTNLVERKLGADFTVTEKTGHTKVQDLSAEFDKFKKSGSADRIKFWEDEIAAHKQALENAKKVKLTPEVLQATNERVTSISKNIESIKDELDILKAKKEEAEEAKRLAEAEEKRLAEEARLAQEAEEKERKQAAEKAKREKQKQKKARKAAKVQQQTLAVPNLIQAVKRGPVYDMSPVFEQYDKFLQTFLSEVLASNQWPEVAKKPLKALESNYIDDNSNQPIKFMTDLDAIHKHVSDKLEKSLNELNAIRLTKSQIFFGKIALRIKATFLELSPTDLRLQKQIQDNQNYPLKDCITKITELQKSIGKTREKAEIAANEMRHDAEQLGEAKVKAIKAQKINRSPQQQVENYQRKTTTLLTNLEWYTKANNPGLFAKVQPQLGKLDKKWEKQHQNPNPQEIVKLTAEFKEIKKQVGPSR